jgi:hypothetical protein
MVRGAWATFNESLAGDKWLAFFIQARGGIGRLHMGAVEAQMRWAPMTEPQIPYELLDD